MDGMKTLSESGVDVFLECGPQGVLSGLGAFILDGTDAVFVASHQKSGDVANFDPGPGRPSFGGGRAGLVSGV